MWHEVLRAAVAKQQQWPGAEVTGAQQLWSVVEGLARAGCQGVQPGTLLHCTGRIQPDVHITVAQAGLRAGCTISLAKPDCTDR